MSAKIATALHEIMAKVAYVQKTGKNSFHGYKYAGEADLLDKLRPAMVEAGLILLPSVKRVSPCDENGNVTVEMEYTLVHKDGDIWPFPIGAAGMGNDRAKNGTVGDKGVYKAITGANKYVLFKLFQIETGDDPEIDSAHDKSSNEPAPEKRVVGFRSNGDRTPHSLRKERVWEEQFIRELDECTTVNAVNKFALAWSLKIEADKWPEEWRELAREEIHKHKLLVANNAPDDDTFPGDIPNGRGQIISTLQAG